MKTLSKAKVAVSKGEYLRLRRLDRQFGAFLSYAAHLLDIEKAREEVSRRQMISQEVLFRRLGL